MSPVATATTTGTVPKPAGRERPLLAGVPVEKGVMRGRGT
jgi:hypothetical protein